ncbi:hypothetical protein BC628DRAFT_1379124 [Trametes gibbosa]|nr:hypothetical protein BC628DRAFT_1379124 [Trametes gibbosa]
MSSAIKAIPVLPGEITDAIIDHLHDSRPALHNCALVCRAWLPSSRHHLFEVFSAGPEKCGLLDLVSFLTSTPDLVGHISRLVLYGYSGIGLTDIAGLINTLCNVRVVDLYNLVISLPRRLEIPPSTPPLALSMLRISSCNVKDLKFDILLRFLDLFGVVKTLRIDQVALPRFSTAQSDTTGAVVIPRNLQISELSLGGMPPSFFVQLVCPSRMAHWGTLRALELDGCIERWSEVGEIGKLLLEIGPRLRHLTLKPSYRLPLQDVEPGGLGGLWNTGMMEDTRHLWAPLNLSKCVNLDEFMFELHYGYQSTFYDLHAFFKLNLDLLTHVPGSVRYIKPRLAPADLFHNQFQQTVGIETGGPLQTFDWRSLDEALCEDRLKASCVILDVTTLDQMFSSADFDLLKGFLAGSLHRTRRRGALTFETRKN